MYAQKKDALDPQTIHEIGASLKEYVTEDNLTDVVLERWKDIPDPRLRQIMQSLIKHLHGFVRDFEPTEAEWATAIDWLARTGRMCSQKRQEFILTSDVLGV
jgi:hydroxyquinol 1,2-dioxygenase